MTDRRTKRNFIKSNDKDLIKKQRRLNEIYRAEREAPLVPLPEPIQRGWRKGFVLRGAASRRNDAPELRRILPQVQYYIYCNRQDFKSVKFHSKQEENLPHELRSIPKNSWDKLQWPEYFKTKWFYYNESIRQGAYGTSYTVKGYFFKYPWYFVPEVVPHFATHSKQIDPNLAREKAEIEAFFEHHQGWRRLNKLRGGSVNWGDPTKQDHLDDIVKHETQKEFEEIFTRPPE